MTRILMHPRELPRYTGSRVQLGDWRWWRRRVHPDADGNLFHQQYDDMRDIHEASILFMDGESVEIVDPPAMNIIMELPDPRDLPYLHSLVSLQASVPQWAECEVVWHSQPSPHWLPLPGNTCLLSQYLITTVTPRERRELDNSSTSLHASRDMPTLRMVRTVHAEQMADVLCMTPAEARVAPGVPTWRQTREVHGWGGQLIGVLQDAYSPNEIRRREGLLPSLPASRITSRSPNVLPESAVIDDIDRLVNEQVRPGPVDDYNVDRYEKCLGCGHDWHGLECKECGCLNTDWLR